MSGAGILLYDPQLKVVLLYQDKEHNRKFHLILFREIIKTSNESDLQIDFPPLLEDIGGKMEQGENPVQCALTEAIQETNNYLQGKISEENLSDQFAVTHRKYICYLVKVKGFELAMAKKHLQEPINAPGYNEMDDVFPISLSSILNAKEELVLNGEKYYSVMDSSNHRELFIYPRTMAILRQCFHHQLFESITENKISSVVLSTPPNKSIVKKRVSFAKSRRIPIPPIAPTSKLTSTSTSTSKLTPTPEWNDSFRNGEKNSIREPFFILFSTIAVIAGATIIILQQK